MSVKVKSTGGGVGGLDIKNSTTASYISYDSDIEPGYFVELTSKASSGTSIDIIPLLIGTFVESKYSVSEGEAINQTYLDCIVPIGEDTYIIAIIDEVYNFRTSQYSNYVHFRKISIDSDGNITSSGSSNCQKCYGNSFLSSPKIYNNVLYYISGCGGSGSVQSQSYYISCIGVTITGSIPSIATIVNHPIGTVTGNWGTLSHFNVDKNGKCFASYYIQDLDGYPQTGVMIFNLTDSSYSNDYVFRYTNSSDNTKELWRVISVTDDNKLYINGAFTDSTFQEGLYTYSSNSLSFYSSIPITVKGYINILDESYMYDFYQTTVSDGIDYNFIIYDYNFNKIATFNFKSEQYFRNMVRYNNILFCYLEKYDNSTSSTNTSIYAFSADFEKGSIQFVTSLFNYTSNSPGEVIGNIYYINSTKESGMIKLTVELIDCIKQSTLKISGITKTKCTPTTAGEVLVLQS